MKVLGKLEKMFIEGKISRREFLTRVSALGLTAALSPGLFPNFARAAAPKKGGRLRLSTPMGSASDSLDPATLTSAMPILISFQLRNCLVEINNETEIIPELAESWECTPDAKRWIFKLRRDVEFHSGKTLEAEDVIFSINLHRKEESKSGAKPIVDQIKEIKADGKYTVDIMLKDGNADIPYLMSDWHLQIVPKGTTNFKDGIGTGGYTLVSYEPGVKSVVKRNPNYWKHGRAHFDEVETLYIADVNARTTALQTGTIDVINQPDLKTIHLLEKDPKLNVVSVRGGAHYAIPMRTSIKPYNNNDVRLALKYAVDREQLKKIIRKGYGSIGNDHPIAPNMKYYASELVQRTYDPDKAKYHLRKAGLEGHTFKLHAADAAFMGSVDMALLYQEHAKKAGIHIKVVKEPDDGYWRGVWMQKEWCQSFWLGRPTENMMFSVAYGADAPWNESYWKHGHFTELIKKTRTELDENKRRQMYFEMQRIVRDEGGTVIPTFLDFVHVASNKLGFDKIAGNIEYDGARIAERWWFKS